MLRRRLPRSLAVLLTAGLATALIPMIGAPTAASPPPKPIGLEPIGTYRDGAFDVSAAEIVAHDPGSQRLFVVNGGSATIDVLDISDPTNPIRVNQVTGLGGIPNSVAVDSGLVAVAVEAPEKDDPGEVVLLDTDGNEINRVTVGALPDMLTFTPNGRSIVVANEGEPFAGEDEDDPPYDPDRDPVGSISIIDVSRGGRSATVRTAGFEAFNDQREALVADGVRLNDSIPTVAQDLEPEYVTVSTNSRTAWVSLQENNSIAEVDLRTATVTGIVPLGRKDHSLLENALDPSDRDGVAEPRTFDNLFGIYMPDAIANVSFRGQTYLLTANEGDARPWNGIIDESRVRDLRDVTGASDRADGLCADAFPERSALVEISALGRLNVSTIDGYNADDNCFEELHVFGGRSFSVFTTDGELVFDSGDEFEQLTGELYPDFFNSDHGEAAFDNRSDNKGPEPEGIAVEKLFGRTYAFIGLERIGGVVVFDVTNPTAPVRVDYVNNRDLAAQFEGQETIDDFVPGAESGDLGPEGLTVIRQSASPTGAPLVVVANEVSGTTTIFRVTR